MKFQYKKSAFTIVELLTVLAIIALLVSLLIPSLNMVRRIAKETAQKAQIASISLALTAFRNDTGDYPLSDWGTAPNMHTNYCGAQRLAEALLGWDLLGFYPQTNWNPDGTAYKTQQGLDLTNRVGPYLELTTAKAFRLGQLFNNPTSLAPDPFVICDSFGVKRAALFGGQIVKAGTPILYYKANPTYKNITAGEFDKRIYSVYDNSSLVALGRVTRTGIPGQGHDLGGSLENLYNFDYENGIRDSRVDAREWPHRADSYILISAGYDGEYGTDDDITNFGN